MRVQRFLQLPTGLARDKDKCRVSEPVRGPGRGSVCSFLVRGYAKFRSRLYDAATRVYDDAGNVIEMHKHAGDFKEP
jgi:hypothetical protein